MNATDAAAFAAKTGAKHSVPIHFGLFDQLDPTIFKTDNAVIPTAYQLVFSEDVQ